MPRRPSSARAAAMRSLASPRRRGPRRRRRAGRRRGRVGVGRGDDEDRATGRGSRAAGSRAAGGPGSRRRRGAAGGRRRRCAGGEQRVVGEDGADADRDRVGFGAPAVDQGAALLAGDPGRVAGRGRGAAVERHRQLQGHQRQAGAGVLAEGLVEQPRRGGLGAGGEARPRRRRRGGSPGPRPAAFSLGSSEAITTRAIPASRIASTQGGWRPWWAQGSSVTYIVAPAGSSPALAAVGQRRPLRVQPAELGVKPLADDLAVAHDDRADQRIRADPPPPALGQLQRPPQMRLIRACELGVHRLID